MGVMKTIAPNTLRTLRMVAAGRTQDDEAVRRHAIGLLEGLHDGKVPPALQQSDVTVRARKAKHE